jgi:arylsulfatase A-like enzyme
MAGPALKPLLKPLTLWAALLLLIASLIITPAPHAFAAAEQRRARLVILMVWDGLRPDSVTRSATPNLYALVHQGVYFSAHHALYPSLTMVNAAGLATGAPSGANGIVGNTMYFAHLLHAAPHATGTLARLLTAPASIEAPQVLAALSGAGGLEGNLVEVETVAQQLLRSGGFVGIVGKTGPTYLFDDRVGAPDHGAAQNEIFVSDDRAVPQSLALQLGHGLSLADFTAMLRSNPPLGDQDTHLAQAFVDHVLPAAASALSANRSALAIFWQHNPDITEHSAGLGTAALDSALRICDANLGRLRAALAREHLEDRTDIMVVSDHGFATIKMRLDFSDLLIAQGLKKSKTSDDLVVAHNFGSDEIYLSPGFDRAARAALMGKIVDYAAAQPWCGPIFSRAAQARPSYAGEIPGTFDEAWFGLLNPARSGDLIISFRELPGEDNSKLTGPQAIAVALSASGMRNERNASQPLIYPMRGVSYADSGHFTTGEGTHGALGQYEMHNFGAALGPDFRRAYIDKAPTSNIDIARTAAALLAIEDSAATGRLLKEALNGGSSPGPYHRVPLSVTLNLPGHRIVTTIEVDRIGDAIYPSNAAVRDIKVSPANP